MTEDELLLDDFAGPRTADAGSLSRLPWGHTTRTVLAGRYPFRVRVGRADLGRHVDRLLAGFPTAPAGQARRTTYSIVSGVNGHPNWWVVYADERRISNCDYPSVALTHLFGHVNRAVVAHSADDAVNLHAAACAWDGHAVVMAGPTESGKSTLAAGLALRGFTYLTDEVVVIDPVDLTVAPYPKPPSIDRGAWSVLPTLKPAVPPALQDVGFTQWHVDPAMLPGGVASSPFPVGLLVRSRWREDSPTVLRPASRGGLVLDLALDMFRPRHLLAQQVRVLCRLAEQALCYELTYSDLDDATAHLEDLMADGPAGPAAATGR